MARVVLSTGGNIGDVKSCLQRAQQLINQRVGAVLRCSHRYESEAWGFTSDAIFSNQVLEVDTDLTAEQVLDAIEQIECELKRDRAKEEEQKRASGEPYASRVIDIDILFYNSDVISTPRLTIPHPRIAQRRFVLVPLCEIMKSYRHPVTGKSIEQMLTEIKQREEI